MEGQERQAKALSAEDDAKLIFGTVFSLRNMVKKLGGPDDEYVCPIAVRRIHVDDKTSRKDCDF